LSRLRGGKSRCAGRKGLSANRQWFPTDCLTLTRKPHEANRLRSTAIRPPFVVLLCLVLSAPQRQCTSNFRRPPLRGPRPHTLAHLPPWNSWRHPSPSLTSSASAPGTPTTCGYAFAGVPSSPTQVREHPPPPGPIFLTIDDSLSCQGQKGPAASKLDWPFSS